MTATVTTLQPTRLPIAQSIAREFELTPTQWRVLVDQIFPAAKSVEAVLMALEYCRVRNLDIYKKPVHIVPMYSTALRRMVETVWPSIAEIRTTAARTGLYAGIDAVKMGPMLTETFKDEVDDWESGQKTGTREVTETVTYPEWMSVVAYKMVEGQRMPFNAIVYWKETYATVGKTAVPNAMWCKRPIGQLGKCLEAAVLRMAFPEEVGSMYAAEEMEGRIIEGVAGAVSDLGIAVPRTMPPAPPTKAEPPKPLTADEGRVVVDEMEAALKEATTTEEVEQRFDAADVQVKLVGLDALLAEAFEIKAHHMKRTTPDEEPEEVDEPAPKATQPERPFPGDTPMPPAPPVRKK